MHTELKVPDGDGGGRFTLLPMSAIYRAEARIEEIAIINTAKAPELIVCFTRAYATLTDHLAVISTQVVKAQNTVAKRSAIVLLDEVPRILREKGVLSARSPGGSEDQRTAVLEMDPEYQVARDRLQELEAYYALVEGKQDNIERAYLAVRKIIGENSYGSRSFGTNFPAGIVATGSDHVEVSGLIGSAGTPITPKQKSDAPQGVRASFGKPRD